MEKWFFSEKGVNDKERDPDWNEYFTSNRSTDEYLVSGKDLTDLVNQWKDGEE